MEKKFVTFNSAMAMLILSTSMFYGVLILETGSMATNLTMCMLATSTICLCIYGLCRMDEPFDGCTKYIGTSDVKSLFVHLDSKLAAVGVVEAVPSPEAKAIRLESSSAQVKKPTGRLLRGEHGSTV